MNKIQTETKIIHLDELLQQYNIIHFALQEYVINGTCNIKSHFMQFQTIQNMNNWNIYTIWYIFKRHKNPDNSVFNNLIFFNIKSEIILSSLILEWNNNCDTKMEQNYKDKLISFRKNDMDLFYSLPKHTSIDCIKKINIITQKYLILLECKEIELAS